MTPHLDLTEKYFVTFPEGAYRQRGKVAERMSEERYSVEFLSVEDQDRITETRILHLSDMRSFAFYSNRQDWLDQCAWGMQCQMAEIRKNL